MFTARTAWRHSEQKIDVVNFQSFNSYLADSVGCTTFSFSVRLGCYFLAVPASRPVKVKDDLLCPQEYECQFRRTLHKSLTQPALPRSDIWYVERDADNLADVIDDAKHSMSQGLLWFDRFQDYQEVYRTLLANDEDVDGTWGYGAKSSPIRYYLTGYVALASGHKAQAAVHLQRALNSGCFNDVQDRLRVDIAAAQND